MLNSSSLKTGHYGVKFARSCGNGGYLNNDICLVSLLILNKARKKNCF